VQPHRHGDLRGAGDPAGAIIIIGVMGGGTALTALSGRLVPYGPAARWSRWSS
jgi:hypothetical protein